MKKISIVTPNYNKSKFLENYIKNLFENQSLRKTDFELVFIDDCSTDNSYELLQSYSKKYNNIKLHKNSSNKGVSYSRNIGVSKSKYEYILFLDSDDILPADTLKFYFDSINKFDFDMLFGNINTFRGEEYPKEVEQKFTCFEIDKYSYFMLYRRQAIWNKVFKKEILKGIEFKEKFGEDFNFLYKCINKSNIIFQTDRKVLNYRLGVADSITNKEITEKKFLEYIEMFNDVYQNLDDEKLKNIIIKAEFASYYNEKFKNFLLNYDNVKKLEMLLKQNKERFDFFLKHKFWYNKLNFMEINDFYLDYPEEYGISFVPSVSQYIKTLEILFPIEENLFEEVNLFEISRFALWQIIIKEKSAYNEKTLIYNSSVNNNEKKYNNNMIESINHIDGVDTLKLFTNKKLYIHNGDFKYKNKIKYSQIQESINSSDLTIFDVNQALYKNSISYMEYIDYPQVKVEYQKFPYVVKSMINNLAQKYGVNVSILENEITFRYNTFLKEYIVFKDLFSKSNFEEVYMIGAYWRKSVIKAAKELNIRTIEYQYALINPYHLAFSYFLPPKIFPHEVIIWGNEELVQEELYYNAPIKKVIGGNYITQKTKVSNQIIDKEYDILIISQWMLQEEFFKLANILYEKTQKKICIKLHPKEQIVYSLNPNIIIAKGREDVYELSVKSSYIVGSWSSALIDIINNDIKVYAIKYKGIEFIEHVRSSYLEIIEEKEFIKKMEG